MFLQVKNIELSRHGSDSQGGSYTHRHRRGAAWAPGRICTFLKLVHVRCCCVIAAVWRSWVRE